MVRCWPGQPPYPPNPNTTVTNTEAIAIGISKVVPKPARNVAELYCPGAANVTEHIICIGINLDIDVMKLQRIKLTLGV